MSVKNTATRQYQAIVNRAAGRIEGQSQPPEGWIAIARKALGMSGAQLAKRLGVTRARISHAERAETRGGITLKTMQAAAEAMGCRFVYAIVPRDGRIEDVIAAQARKKAKSIVSRASDHMALENQALSSAQNAEEVEHIARDLIRAMPSDLWVDS